MRAAQPTHSQQPARRRRTVSASCRFISFSRSASRSFIPMMRRTSSALSASRLSARALAACASASRACAARQHDSKEAVKRLSALGFQTVCARAGRLRRLPAAPAQGGAVGENTSLS